MQNLRVLLVTDVLFTALIIPNVKLLFALYFNIPFLLLCFSCTLCIYQEKAIASLSRLYLVRLVHLLQSK